MKQIDVITVGSAVKDIMFYSDKVNIIKNLQNLTSPELLTMEYGAKIEIEDVFVNYGGGALNVAVGLSNFGLKVAPLINIGKDWVGREIYYFLKKKKIKPWFVNFDKYHTTGFSVIITVQKDKEHTIFTYKGATVHLRVPSSLVKHRPRWFYVSPLSMKNWSAEFDKIVKVSQHKYLPSKIAWNPGSKQLADYKKMKKFLPQIEVLILNKDEAVELALNLLGKKVEKKKINQSRYLLDGLKLFGVKNIIITSGKKGVYGLDSKGHYYFKHARPAKKIVDTVGAGDAFSSGFLASFSLKNNFEKALELGLKNSVSVLTQVGAQNGLLNYKLR